jgi:hypothetical protein
MILIQLNDTPLSLDVLPTIWEPMRVLYYNYAVHED